MEGEHIEVVAPKRNDGTPKAFWFDPRFPMHILHQDRDGYRQFICVGHEGD